MPATEGFGRTGWAALLVLVLGILAVLLFGFAAAIYIGILLTCVALVVMVMLCQGEPANE